MNFNVICENILNKNGITKSFLFNILEDLSFKKINYGDIYFQDCSCETWLLENREIKFNVFNNIKGVSLRVVFLDKTIFSCSNEINVNSILSLVDVTKSSLFFSGNGGCNCKLLSNVISNNFYGSVVSVNNLLVKEKVDLLFYLDNFIRKIDNRINYVSVELFNNYEFVLVVSTDGMFIGDIRPLVKLLIKVQVEKDGCREFGYSGGGGRYSFDDLMKKRMLNNPIVEYWANEAVRVAVNNLGAICPYFGNVPVVLGSGSPGILLHEAVGHGLEGDFNRKGVSCFKDSIGCKVASDLCTVIDNGTIIGNRGTLNIDDEGVFTKKNILIENGILRSYMFDKLNANLMGVVSTGNSRRESYLSLPIPRMTSTYLLSGNDTLNDMISSIDYGLYIVSLGSGQVDIISGKFVFTISEAYVIKSGKIKNSVKGVTLIGTGIDVMNKISMVGNDLKFDDGLGTCCKDGQSIPVSVGQPSIKIDSMIVGGID